VQAERLGRRAVLMVRRRSTVRFGKGAPGKFTFSKLVAISFVAFVERVVETFHVRFRLIMDTLVPVPGRQFADAVPVAG